MFSDTNYVHVYVFCFLLTSGDNPSGDKNVNVLKRPGIFETTGPQVGKVLMVTIQLLVNGQVCY